MTYGIVYTTRTLLKFIIKIKLCVIYIKNDYIIISNTTLTSTKKKQNDQSSDSCLWNNSANTLPFSKMDYIRLSSQFANFGYQITHILAPAYTWKRSETISLSTTSGGLNLEQTKLRYWKRSVPPGMISHSEAKKRGNADRNDGPKSGSNSNKRKTSTRLDFANVSAIGTIWLSDLRPTYIAATGGNK